MGLFAPAPFDTDVEKATDEKNTGEDWGQIMDICDKVSSSPNGPKDCMKSIMKRASHQDPHVALQALLLLDACINNCGKNFHLEVASREFEGDFKRLLSRTQQTQQRTVSDKLKSLLKKWAELPEFTKDPQLSLIPSLYRKLQEDYDFSSVNHTPEKVHKVSKDPNVVSSQQEEDDIAKAIELSLRETSGKNSSSAKSSSASSSLYPSATSLSFSSPVSLAAPSTEIKVRALYDFEAAEDNELSFHAGDILIVSDNSDPNWWKGSSHRGEGLFPANFVTTDLSEGQQKPARSVQFNEAVEVKTVSYEEEEARHVAESPLEIDEGKIDRLLHSLHEADPTEDDDVSGLDASLERQVNAMGPLIDAELERVDRRHAQLTQLSAELVGAFNLYHSLMREQPKMPPPTAGPPYGYMSPQHQPQPIYDGVGLYSSMPPGMYQQPQPPTSMPSELPQYMQHGGPVQFPGTLPPPQQQQQQQQPQQQPAQPSPHHHPPAQQPVPPQVSFPPQMGMHVHSPSPHQGLPPQQPPHVLPSYQSQQMPPTMDYPSLQAYPPPQFPTTGTPAGQPMM